MRTLSIIIVNYNTKSLLHNCIKSIKNNTKSYSYEIIVIDNASNDGSSDMIKENFQDVILIENKENLGFGKANNLGMKRAKGNYYLLLNSDTIVKPEAIEKMIDFIESNPNIGMVGPRLLNDDGTIQSSISNFPNLWYVILRMFKLRKIIPSNLLYKIGMLGLLGPSIKSYLQAKLSIPIEIDNVSGACMLIRKKVIEDIGIFDENYFMYVEDIDLCKRIRNAGWKIYYYPHSEIVHLLGKSSGGTFRDLSPASYQSLYYYFRKHHGRLYELLVRFIVIIALISRGVVNALLEPLKTISGDNKILKSYIEIIKESI